ncbi:MAG: hypothetical protein WCF24_08885 [Acidimicrobiales bacterium]
MTAIIVVGVGLIVYSRNEALHPTAAKVGPSLTDNWQAALGIDICGTIEPNLPASANLSTTGLRTFGNGLIDAAPDVSSAPSKFEGAKATLGLFAKNYSGFTLTSTQLGYPGKHEKIYKKGEACTGKVTGKGTLVARVWASPTARSSKLVDNPTTVHITNGEMITVAFVPSGTTIPQPPSKGALETAIGSPSSGSKKK